MIPFARIVQYGNVVVPEVIKIKKMEFGNQHYLLLNSKGELYGSGNNSNRQYVSSGAVTTGWNLIANGVDDCWAGGFWSCYKKDGVIYYIGTGGLSTGTTNSYTAITSAQLGTVVMSDIVNIFGTNLMMHFSTSDGKLYAIGPNTNGNSGLNTGTVAITQLTEVTGLNGTPTNLPQYMRYATDGTALLQMTGGYMYGWGKNSSGMLANANQVAVGVPKAISFGSGGVICGYSGMSYMAASGLWSCGDQVYGQIGTGYTTGTNSYITSIKQANYTGTKGGKIISPMGGGRTWNNAFINQEGLWITGISSPLLGNTTSGTLGSYTKVPCPVAFDNIVGYGIAAGMSIVSSDTELYQCGSTIYMIGYGSSGTVYGLSKVKLPWDE